MKRSIIPLCIVLFFFISNCGSAKLSKEVKQEAYNDLKVLVESGTFKFKADTAYPMQSNSVIAVTNTLMRGTENANGRFSLSGNEEFLEINLNTAKANLTYFGELRSAAYSDSRDTSIIFNAEPSDYELVENEKKKTVTLSFNIKNSAEQFIVKMVLFSNKKANVHIYSSNRTNIRYNGTIIAL